MAIPYQNNMYPQMPYGQQPQYGVNSYLPYMQQQRFQQPEPMQPVQPVQMTQQQARGLNGMVVQTVENVTADCVPMDGSPAFFPKNDMSEIYVKNWSADGTIRTLIYRPIEVSAGNQKNDSGLSENATTAIEQRLDELFGKIEQLEQTITNSITKRTTSTVKKAGDQ